MERQECKKMGDVLMKFLSENGLDKGLVYARVCNAYDTVVGPVFSVSTTEKSFENGVLRCRINSSVKRQQLSFNAETIKEKINGELETALVKKILFN